MGKKLEKQIITIIVDGSFEDSLEGDVERVIKRLQNIKERYGSKTNGPYPGNPKVDECEWFSLYHDYDYDYDGERLYTTRLDGHRYETDEEFEARKKKRNANNAKKRAAAKKKRNEAEEAEKELYRKLQKKYGG